MKRTTCLLLVALCLIFVSTTAFAFGTRFKKSCGQTVYLPVAYYDSGYEYDPDGPGEQPPIWVYEWATTSVDIRNINRDVPIRVNRVTYHNYEGEPVHDFVTPDSPAYIKGWQSQNYVTSPVQMVGVWPAPKEDGMPFVIIQWEAESMVIPAAIKGAVVILDPRYGPNGRIKGLSFTEPTVLEERAWSLCK